jgi:hypothetical protein
VGRAPILEEVPPEHVVLSFRITLDLQKWRKSLNNLVGYEYVRKIPKGAN